MLSNEIQGRVDRLWQDFWPGSALKPFSVLEFLTYLIYLKRYDASAQYTSTFSTHNVQEDEEAARPQLAWGQLVSLPEEELYQEFYSTGGVLDRIKSITVDDPYFTLANGTEHLLVPTSSLLQKSFELIEVVDFNQREIGSGFYSYLVSKAQALPQTGQEPTDLRVVAAVSEILNVTPGDKVVELCAGSASFLAYAAKQREEKLLKYSNFKNVYASEAGHALIAIDSDPVVAKIGVMHLELLGVKGYQYSIDNALNKKSAVQISRANVVFAHIPPSTAIDYSQTEPSLIKQFGSIKKSSVFLSRILEALQPGARAAIIVPKEVLIARSNEQQAVRKDLVENTSLQAVIELPTVDDVENHDQPTLLLFRKAMPKHDEQILLCNMTGRTGDASFVVDVDHVLQKIVHAWKTREKPEDEMMNAVVVTAEEIRSRQYSLDADTYQKPVVTEEVQTDYYNPFETEERLRSKTRSRRRQLTALFLILAACTGAWFYYTSANNNVDRPIGSIQVVEDSTSTPIIPAKDSSTSTAPVERTVTKPRPDNTRTERKENRASENSSASASNREVKGKYKIVNKAYFHNQPDQATRRDAYVVHWNNSYATINALEDANGFVYVEFKNHLGQTSKGWLNKRDLRKID